MNISSTSGVINIQAGQMLMPRAKDSISENIQSLISNAEKQLQELSSNKEMTAEEKMNKRQEIQQQISDLNKQLRQHQLEQRKEQQKERAAAMDDMLGGNRKKNESKSEDKKTGLSQASMEAMISADASMKQARVYGNTATAMEGRADVLGEEIRQDAGRGVRVEKKQEEQASLTQKAQAATSSQLSNLADAYEIMEEAAEEDRKDAGTSAGSVKSEEQEASKEQTLRYTPIDIRL